MNFKSTFARHCRYSKFCKGFLFICQLDLTFIFAFSSVSVQGTSVTIVDLSDPKQPSGQTGDGQSGGAGNTYSFKYDTIKAEPDKRKKRSIVSENLLIILSKFL